MKIENFKSEYIFDLHIDYEKYPLYNQGIVFLHNLLYNGVTRTLLDDDGSVIAFVSVMILHKGVACVHILPSKEAHSSKKKSFVSGILELRKELELVVSENNIRRLETLTIDDKFHNRWMEYLGFLPDGVKRQYGLNGEDYIMWSRLWEQKQQ